MEILCKYQDKCKNSKCTYAHLTDLTKSVLCKYGNKCNNMYRCKLLHPKELKPKKKLCQYQDKCSHIECRFIHLDNLYKCDTCEKLTWTTTDVLTDRFMIELLRDSKIEGHAKGLKCNNDTYNNTLLSESSSYISDSDNEENYDTTKVNIMDLLPKDDYTLDELYQLRDSLNTHIENKEHTSNNSSK